MALALGHFARMRLLHRLVGLAAVAAAAPSPTLSGVAPPFPGPTSAFLGPVDDAQFNFAPYQLTDVCLACDRRSAADLYSCSVSFGWFDPNSVKENRVTSCACSYTWSWDGTTTTQGANNTFDDEDFVVCTNRYPSVFEMRVNAFAGPASLALFMSHFYKDSTLWGAPYLFAQTWAMPVLNLSLQTHGDNSMVYALAGPVLANITGLQG